MTANIQIGTKVVQIVEAGNVAIVKLGDKTYTLKVTQSGKLILN